MELSPAAGQAPLAVVARPLRFICRASAASRAPLALAESRHHLLREVRCLVAQAAPRAAAGVPRRGAHSTLQDGLAALRAWAAGARHRPGHLCRSAGSGHFGHRAGGAWRLAKTLTQRRGRAWWAALANIASSLLRCWGLSTLRYGPHHFQSVGVCSKCCAQKGSRPSA